MYYYTAEPVPLQQEKLSQIQRRSKFPPPGDKPLETAGQDHFIRVRAASLFLSAARENMISARASRQ